MLFYLANGEMRCPVCDMQMTVTERPHEVAVNATHKNNKCAYGNLTFRVNPRTGYAEKVAA